MMILWITIAVNHNCYLWGLFVDTHGCGSQLLPLVFVCWYTWLWISVVTSGVCLLILMSVDHSYYLWGLFVDTHGCGSQLLPLVFVCWYTWLWILVVTSGVCLLILMSVDHSYYLWGLFVDTHVCVSQLLPQGLVWDYNTRCLARGSNPETLFLIAKFYRLSYPVVLCRFFNKTILHYSVIGTARSSIFYRLPLTYIYINCIVICGMRRCMNMLCLYGHISTTVELRMLEVHKRNLCTMIYQHLGEFCFIYDVIFAFTFLHHQMWALFFVGYGFERVPRHYKL